MCEIEVLQRCASMLFCSQELDQDTGAFTGHLFQKRHVISGRTKQSASFCHICIQVNLAMDFYDAFDEALRIQALQEQNAEEARNEVSDQDWDGYGATEESKGDLPHEGHGHQHGDHDENDLSDGDLMQGLQTMVGRKRRLPQPLNVKKDWELMFSLFFWGVVVVVRLFICLFLVVSCKMFEIQWPNSIMFILLFAHVEGDPS